MVLFLEIIRPFVLRLIGRLVENPNLVNMESRKKLRLKCRLFKVTFSPDAYIQNECTIMRYKHILGVRFFIAKSYLGVAILFRMRHFISSMIIVTGVQRTYHGIR